MSSQITIIAEAGVNHNGSLDLALELVERAACAGANVVKFQTFSAERVASECAPKAAYQQRQTATDESQLEMLRRLELGLEAHRTICDACRKRGIEFLSTPFDPGSLRLLVDQIGVARLKVSSGDLTNGPLLLAIARAKLPVILSTGMGTLGEIEDALSVLAFGFIAGKEAPSDDAFRAAFRSVDGQSALLGHVTLLHCVSAYPAPAEQTNLRAMATMRAAFGLPTGLSDHSQGTAIAIGAAALGASMIEKHLTVDRSLPGPDHQASLSPSEFTAMVEGIREIEAALGSPRKLPVAEEEDTMRVARRGIVAVRDIAAGEPFTEAMLEIRRPQLGVSPMRFWSLVGRRAPRRYRRGEPIDDEPLARA